MSTCTCCGEHEAHPLCDGLCIDCARPQMCACGRELDASDVVEWSPEQQIACQCAACLARAGVSRWVESTCREIERLAAQHEWTTGSWQVAQTGSRYAELHRECSSCILGSDEDCTCERLTVRVSDHGTRWRMLPSELAYR